MTHEDIQRAIAESIWDIRRDHEDRCDIELDDVGNDHPVWDEADSVISTLVGLGLLVMP